MHTVAWGAKSVRPVAPRKDRSRDERLSSIWRRQHSCQCMAFTGAGCGGSSSIPFNIVISSSVRTPALSGTYMSLRRDRVVGCPVSQPSAPQVSSAPGRIDPQLTSAEARGFREEAQRRRYFLGLLRGGTILSCKSVLVRRASSCSYRLLVL